MNLKTVYLVLAILGTVLPYAFFINFGLSEGLDLSGFLTALFANGAVGGFTVDLVLSSVVFWIFMFSRAGPKPGPFIAMNLLVGLSCALPAYLYCDCISMPANKSRSD